MWVVFKVHTGVTELGNYTPGDVANIRDADAELVIKRGWALVRPDLEKKLEPEPEPEAEAEPEEDPELEQEEIETPEDSHPHRKRETATLKRKKKR